MMTTKAMSIAIPTDAELVDETLSGSWGCSEAKAA
jgi:hypothetical protein